MADVDLPEITEVKRLALRPGDRIVLRFPDALNEQQVDDIQAAMLHAFGDLDPRPKVIVLDGGADIEVLGPEGEAARPQLTLQFNGGAGDEFIRSLRENIRRDGGGSVQSVLGAS